MVLKLKTGPALEPVSLQEVKNQLRIDGTDEDLYLAGLVASARERIENLCGPIMTQTWYQYEDEWPGGDELIIAKPRLQTVTSIKYTDSDGVQSTLAATDYTVDTAGEQKPRIVLKDTATWPSDELFNVRPIVIEFVCGYGTDPNLVPVNLWRAMLILVSHWHAFREPVVSGQMSGILPFGVDDLVGDYRLWGF
jgi:uncharacterized phiE125 gp8 family phage protein